MRTEIAGVEVSLARADKNAAGAEEQYQAALAAVTATAFRTASARDKQEVLWSFISRRPYGCAVDEDHRLSVDAQADESCLSPQGLRPGRRRETAAGEGLSCVRHRGEDPLRRRRQPSIYRPLRHRRRRLQAGVPGGRHAELQPGRRLEVPARWTASIRKHAAAPIAGYASEPGLLRAGAHESHPGARPVPEHALAAGPEILALPDLHPIELQRLDHLAAVTSNGTVVQRPPAPELVYLYGADEVRNDPASTEDFRSLFGDIPPGSLLYRMYGKAARDAKKIDIGCITTESAFVASEFGDRILAFRHAWTANAQPATWRRAGPRSSRKRDEEKHQ